MCFEGHSFWYFVALPACNALEPVHLHTHEKSRTSEHKIMANLGPFFSQFNSIFAFFKSTVVFKQI